MHVIMKVYTALRSFNRPATRREIEREAGLDRDAVAAGLRGLNRPGRRLLVRHAVEPGARGLYSLVPGARGLYSLVPGAPAPTDLRGRWLHDEAWRERQRQGVQAYQAARASGSHPAPRRPALAERVHTTAMVPTHFSAPGSLRTEATARCLLAELWPHRR